MKRLTTTQAILVVANLLGLLLLTVVWLKLPKQAELVETTKPTSQPTSQISPVEPSRLMPNRNHNHAAAAYAYDITLINQYLHGEKVYTGNKLVFLTIDDGASHITEGMLDILQAEQVPATFFPIASQATEDQAAIYRRQLREGHAIGLHSYSHNFSLLYPGGFPNTDHILSEAQESEKAFKRLFGLRFKTRLWRYPGGAASWAGLEPTHAKLAEFDWHWLDWNANIGDGEPFYRRPQSLEVMLAFHQQTDQNHQQSPYPYSPADIKVVLLHDASDKQLTLEALSHIIHYYKTNGYTFGVLY